MRKLIFMFVAMMFATLSLSAQTVTPSKWYDNVYVGLSAGTAAWLHPHDVGFNDFKHSSHVVSGLRLGKYVTPVVGFELEGEVGMAYHDRFVDHTTASGNLLFNLNNLVHKYKGKPDRIEFVTYAGLGWNRTYGNDVNHNISTEAGVQVNFNLGKLRRWQINVIPSINYMLTDDGFLDVDTYPKFDSQRAYLNGQVGVTYKFKNKNKTHNFTLCPYSYTQDDYDKWKELMKNADETIRSKDAKLIEYSDMLIEKQKEIDRLNARNMVVENVVNVNSAVGFKIGQSNILETHKASLETLADAVKNTDTKLVVVGYADAKTGTKARNQWLSEKRANVVKDYLVKLGVNADNITIDAKGDTEQPFSENNLNRVVIFSVK